MIKRFPILSEDEAMIGEFLKNPFGPHPLRLQQIMNMLRGSSLRLGILCMKPFQEWVLVTFHGPKKPLEIHPDVKFTSLIDAEIEIFRRRWIDCTGKDPLVHVKNSRL